MSLMAAYPLSSPSKPSSLPPTLPLSLRSLTLTASPQPLVVSTRIIVTVAVADHTPSPNHEYIHDSDHLDDYAPVDHVDGLISDPVDDHLVDFNTGYQRVAVDVVDCWKQIRVVDINNAARKLL